MKLHRLSVQNFRSIINADVEIHNYTMIVGANNAGKSNLLAALRAFYEDIKWSVEDVPRVGKSSDESWVQLTFKLTDEEWSTLQHWILEYLPLTTLVTKPLAGAK